MVNYKDSKVYKIVCNITGEIYIGSTTQPTLAMRLATHKQHSNSCKSKQIIERGNYIITLIENYPCNNRDELHSRERYYIDTNCCINKKKPLTPLERETYSKDYRNSHKDYFKVKCKNWRVLHPDYMKINCKIWRDTRKEVNEKCGKITILDEPIITGIYPQQIDFVDLTNREVTEKYLKSEPKNSYYDHIKYDGTPFTKAEIELFNILVSGKISLHI